VGYPLFVLTLLGRQVTVKVFCRTFPRRRTCP